MTDVSVGAGQIHEIELVILSEEEMIQGSVLDGSTIFHAEAEAVNEM